MKDPRPGDVAPTNSNGNQQINYFGERYGWVVALLIGIIALVLAAGVWFTVSAIARDVENVRGLIENSAANASQAAADAARAAERAFQAQQSAAINREYAVQVFPQLNRLGIPVRSPGEVDHYVAQPEDYAELDAYHQQKQEQQPLPTP